MRYSLLWGKRLSPYFFSHPSSFASAHSQKNAFFFWRSGGKCASSFIKSGGSGHFLNFSRSFFRRAFFTLKPTDQGFYDLHAVLFCMRFYYFSND